MKNSIGSSVILTLFGESHGEAVGAVLDGLAPGIEIDEAFINKQLSRRRPSGPMDTARVEKDNFKIVSGIYKGFTNGSPITFIIPNENLRSNDYAGFEGIARPSHADYTAEMKYHGFQDPRGGGHFSGRVTAGIVAAGAICIKALESKGIKISTHILECAGVQDTQFSNDPQLLCEQIKALDSKNFPIIDNLEKAVCDAILAAKSDKDSLGGKIQTVISGAPAGIGEPWFDSLEGVISRAIFAIGGIKGIEFGSGFGLCEMRGTEANDAFRLNKGKVVTSTNHSGGINGGISNGMPIIFNMAVKPTPSIASRQQSVDYKNGREVDLELVGRHDPAIIRRICIVVTSLIAIVLCDVLSLRYGTDYLSGHYGKN